MTAPARAEFRFYEELNDFLPAERRRRGFRAPVARGATAKQAIEALGVPHTEVEIVLANGESVGFDHRVRDGDRIAVYPTFEALDVRALLRVRPAPLRVTRFFADAHFAALARRLRMLGFDTRLAQDVDDADIVRLAREERRIVLSRDRELLKRRDVTHGCYVRARRADEQAAEVLARLDLAAEVRAFTRCIECNEPLRDVQARAARGRVPEDVLRRHCRFAECRACGRVYWQGSHYRAMARRVGGLVGEVRGSR